MAGVTALSVLRRLEFIAEFVPCGLERHEQPESNTKEGHIHGGLLATAAFGMSSAKTTARPASRWKSMWLGLDHEQLAQNRAKNTHQCMTQRGLTDIGASIVVSICYSILKL